MASLQKTENTGDEGSSNVAFESMIQKSRPDKFKLGEKYDDWSNESLHQKWLEFDAKAARKHHPNDRRKALAYVPYYFTSFQIHSNMLY